MVQFLPIKSLEAPDASINFSPLGNALSEFGQVNRQVEQRDYERRQAEENKRYSRGRAGGDDTMKKVEWFGQKALAIDQIQDEPTRQAAWKSWITQHGADGLGPEELDHRTGPKLAAAAAGKWLDPNKSAMDRAELEYKQAQTKTLSDKQNDPVEQYLLQRLQGMNKPAASAPQAPAPQQPMLQNQSFEGAPQTMPGITLAGDTQQAPQAMPPEAMPSGKSIEEIDTPYGRMSRDEARQLGGTMLLTPRYAPAGRALLDSLEKAAGGDIGLSKPSQTQLEERTISAASTLGRLQEVKRLYRPEFQQIPEKLKMYGASWNAAITGKVPPAMQKPLEDYSRYKAAAFDNFNQILKELSGTAVSAQELSRQKIVQPNPGEGLFDGDDPITFKAKIDQVERLSVAAIARMNFMRANGLQFNKDTAEQFMRLEDVPAAVERRGTEIEQQIRQANPTADPSAIQGAVAQKLKQEFGI